MAYEPVRSADTLIETPIVDSIKSGGPSSSLLLNQLRGSVQADLVRLSQKTNDTELALARAASLLSAQTTAFTSRLNGLEALMPSATGRWLADFFTSAFTYTGNTADISTVYGQATLPIRSTEEKLVGTDARGDVWVPNDTQIHYSYKTTTPSESDWLADEEALYALDGRYDTAWWRDKGTTGTVWVRIKVPPLLNASQSANTICLHPFPSFSTDLLDISYRATNGSWTTADLSYIEGWNGTKVVGMGNARLLFAAVPITEIRLKLNVITSLWGFQWIALRSTQFTPTASLIVTFSPYSLTSAAAASLYGKDQSSLNLPTTITNGTPTTVTVGLSQSSSYVSPVLTGIEVR